MQADTSHEEQDFVLWNLSPSPAQKRLALGIVLVLVVTFAILAGPLSTVQLPRISRFVPMYATAMLVIDSITAVLLFAQFSILRSRALLFLSSGYLFTALILVPWMLTFPGIFARNGLLGAGIQSTAWIYILWHGGFPLFVIAYALQKDDSSGKRFWQGSAHMAILSSVAVVLGLVCAGTLLATAGSGLLPQLMLDAVRLAQGWMYAAAAASTLNLFAIGLLWVRRRSVLDLWLMVVMCAVVTEIVLVSFPVPERFSLGWYGGRICGLLSGSLLLCVLLFEISTLYGRLLNAVLGQRRERVARLMTGDAVSASIAHEVKNPLSAMILNAQTGLRWLDRTTPQVEKAREAFKQVVLAGDRAAAVIEGIRAVFKKDVTARTSVDINGLAQEALTLMRSQLQRQAISVQANLDEGLPRVNGDPVQLQQVLLNLITNAIDSMTATEQTRMLRIKSKVHDDGCLVVSVEDNGAGIDPDDVDRIFNPLFTTKSQGMGMGLSICRSIIQAHGGQLWVESNAPQGAIFQFSLPTGSSNEPPFGEKTRPHGR